MTDDRETTSAEAMAQSRVLADSDEKEMACQHAELARKEPDRRHLADCQCGVGQCCLAHPPLFHESERQMIKRRVQFVMPVDIEAEDEKAFAEAIKEYRNDPCYASNCGAWGWRQGRPYLPRKAKRVTPRISQGGR